MIMKYQSLGFNYQVSSIVSSIKYNILTITYQLLINKYWISSKRYRWSIINYQVWIKSVILCFILLYFAIFCCIMWHFAIFCDIPWFSVIIPYLATQCDSPPPPDTGLQIKLQFFLSLPPTTLAVSLQAHQY